MASFTESDITTVESTTTVDTTISTTIVATSTITCAAGANPTSFALKAVYDGKYIKFIGAIHNNQRIDSIEFQRPVGDLKDASLFTIIENGNLLAPGGFSPNNPGDTGITDLYLNQLGSSHTYLTCSVASPSPASGALSCNGYTGPGVFYACSTGSGRLYFGPTTHSPPSGCIPMSFTAVSLC